MTIRRKTAKIRRRKKTNRRPLSIILVLLAILALCAGLFYMNEFLGVTPKKRMETPQEVIRQKIPPRVTEQPAVLEDYSSSILPSPISPEPAKKPRKVRHGTVAIIIDDMGSSVHEAEALLAIDVPLTFSVIPGLPKAREVADAAFRKGREVMIHIPMEPTGYQQKPFEKDGLLLAQSDEEIEKKMKGYLGRVPHAVGANNHMGSRFTEDRAKMYVVLDVLKKKNMYFIDSKTTPASVGDKLAREMGMKNASRNVFLDNVQEVKAIKVQIEKLAAMAKKGGSAIGICHPHKTTIQALGMTLPVLNAEGITFVKASMLVR